LQFSISSVARYFLFLAYEGTRYQGWQVQPHTTDTVQAVLNAKLSMLLREPIEVTGCGRTDTGVHASAFYAHFDFSAAQLPEPEERFVYHLNAVLPADIAVYAAQKVSDTAHARFDATYREYEYHITRIKNPFGSTQSWLLRDELDVAHMNACASLFLQQTDFGAFCKSGGNAKTTLCTVSRAFWRSEGHRLIFTIGANRFLRNMVRAAVGTLLDAGRSKLSVEDVQRILQSGNRSEAGQSVPARGLFLTDVHYPAHLSLQPDMLPRQ
jgi:tRNA pseudouridine38-40 synthase